MKYSYKIAIINVIIGKSNVNILMSIHWLVELWRFSHSSLVLHIKKGLVSIECHLLFHLVPLMYTLENSSHLMNGKSWNSIIFHVHEIKVTFGMLDFNSRSYFLMIVKITRSIHSQWIPTLKRKIEPLQYTHPFSTGRVYPLQHTPGSTFESLIWEHQFSASIESIELFSAHLHKAWEVEKWGRFS